MTVTVTVCVTVIVTVTITVTRTITSGLQNFILPRKSNTEHRTDSVRNGSQIKQNLVLPLLNNLCSLGSGAVIILMLHYQNSHDKTDK